MSLLRPPRSWVRIFAALLLVCSVSSASSPRAQQASSGRLEPFSSREQKRLSKGKSVKRKFQIEQGGRSYHAGLSYRLVKGTPMDVIRTLRRPQAILTAIPYGLEATTLSEKRGVSRIRILQGKRPVTGEYTVWLDWDLPNYRARFWLDPSEPHDIRDIWGVFSAREVRPGWTLVSFGFAFDIGGMGELLEDKAQKWALRTADRLVRLMKSRARSSTGSSRK